MGWLSATLVSSTGLVGKVVGATERVGPTSLAAVWADDAGQHHVGVLAEAAQALVVVVKIPVPTRAHGLCLEPSGSMLSVARRPGDWLLRWRPDGRIDRWLWIESDRAFNGHVLCATDGSRVYTTETRLDTGQGLIGVRDAVTLRKLDEWPTHGVDPHELDWIPERLSGGRDALVVANGGIPTWPETGRIKQNLSTMDSSLVRLDAVSGQLMGQWRLADPRLSLRHLAWLRGRSSLDSAILGVALQAEHDDIATRQAAPVLALWDGHALTLAEQPQSMAGYGGDVERTDDGFVVSSPKAGLLGRWSAQGRWLASMPLENACALAAQPQSLWMGGQTQLIKLVQPGATFKNLSLPTAMRLDNHWRVMKG